MSEVTIEMLIEEVKKYNPDEVEIVKKAYNFAKDLHRGQKRQSGEDYIIHPLNVAYILAGMHADRDTLCAGLLHDTLEDTNFTKEDIIKNFNETIANLVDGVTKISGLDYSKQELNYVNTQKIIMGVTEDVRIIIIKLADRLHNMRTLQYKSLIKQQENALETMNIFVPFAYYIGNHLIKNELEDLSFRYLNPEKYKKYENIRIEHERVYEAYLQEMVYKIKKTLEDNDIPNEIKYRIKNIYGIYKNRHCKGDIHDLYALKIIVDEELQCYNALRLIHKQYHPINSYFKDFICNPKTNMYQSLHTTVFGPNDRLVQTQIRTKEMDKVATYGLTTSWDINKAKACHVMQNDLQEKFQFFESLLELKKGSGDSADFVNKVRNELFADNVYVYTTKGEVKELPKGSTVIDFAYYVHTEVGNNMISALVNEEVVPIDYILKSNDRVKIITEKFSAGPNFGWLDIAQTTRARKKIKDYIKKENNR